MAVSKEDLKNFADLRKDALELVYNLFQKYNLNESDRLTEATSTLFSQIIAEPDPIRLTCKVPCLSYPKIL